MEKIKLRPFSFLKQKVWRKLSFAGYCSKPPGTIVYLGCKCDSELSGKDITYKSLEKINVLKKINVKLEFKVEWTMEISKWDAIIQPHSDCGCSSWFSLVIRKIENQTSKCSK